MEVIDKQVSDYYFLLKKNIIDKVNEIIHGEKNVITELSDYLDKYEPLKIKKDEKTKIKTVNPLLRCNAKRVGGERCSRRRDGEFYCSLHRKSLPFGTYIEPDDQNAYIIQVSSYDIQGIIFYIDEYLNIYETEDIYYGKENPRIIGKAIRSGDTYRFSPL